MRGASALYPLDLTSEVQLRVRSSPPILALALPD